MRAYGRSAPDLTGRSSRRWNQGDLPVMEVSRVLVRGRPDHADSALVRAGRIARCRREAVYTPGSTIAIAVFVIKYAQF
jgi:hypothetical protein